MAQWFLDVPTDARSGAEILALFTRTVVNGTQTFEIFTDGTDKVLRMYRATSGGTPSTRVTINDLGMSVGDCDIVVLERLLLSSSDRRSGPAARVNGTETSHSLYTASASGAVSSISELAAEVGKGTQLSEVTGISISGTDYVWKRFQVSGTTLRVKQWLGARGDEPAEWQQTTTDSTLTTGGVGFHNVGGSTTIGDYRVKTIAVGTGGDAPPTGPVGGGDTTAPTLTSPTGTATGTTTASGTVSTNEATGSLFYLASTNASEDPAVVIAASSQAVSATGSQSVSFTGLTPSTTYYAHYLHRDAAGYDSAVATSAGFTTPAAGDTTPPDLTGSITISALTTTSYTATWPAGSDNVAVTGYEYRIAGGAWVDRGNNLSVNITGRTPGATETFEVRAYDAAGYRSTPALSTSVTLNSAASITTSALRNNTGTVHASTTVQWTWFPAGRIGQLELVTPQDGTGTTDASGQLTVSGLTAPGILMVVKLNTDATDDDVYYEAFD